MKLTKLSKRGGESLYSQFLTMTILPLVVSGLLMMVVCTYSMRRGMSNEIRSELSDVACTVLAAYDEMYPGDYEARLDTQGQKAVLYKGDVCLSEKHEFVDDIKSRCNLEISIVYLDERLVTTVIDPETGDRALNSGISENIRGDIYNKGTDKFVANALIGKGKYYAYYMPVKNGSDDSIVGIIGVAKSTEEVDQAITVTGFTNVFVMGIAIAITVIFILIFANRIILMIKYMIEFMKKLAVNDFDITLNDQVIHRSDEFGIMGRMLIDLQLSLRKLIERDALTGLYNRRYAEKKLDKIERDGIKYSVSIGDIDFFKKYNDTYGHECGDVVLKEIAALLNASMSGKGFVARWGGEEFLLVYENMDINRSYDALIALREAIHDKEIDYNGEPHKVTMTFGVAESIDGVSIHQLIKAADDKLYDGKQSGRDRVIR